MHTFWFGILYLVWEEAASSDYLAALMSMMLVSDDDAADANTPNVKDTSFYAYKNKHWKHAPRQNTWSISSKYRFAYTVTLQDASVPCSSDLKTSSHIMNPPENEKSPAQSSKTMSNRESLQKNDRNTTPVAWLYLFTCGLFFAIWIIS